MENEQNYASGAPNSAVPMRRDTAKPLAPFWTKPFYGVQHLRVSQPSKFQVTVSDHVTFANLQIFNLWKNNPFTDGCEETWHASAEDARIAGEAKARQMGTV